MLSQKKIENNWKAEKVDLSSLLYQPKICSNDYERYHTENQDHELHKTLDMNTLLQLCSPAIEKGKKISAKLAIKNTDRVTGTILSSEIARKYGEKGLPEDTINLDFVGSAGQSFGAFLAPGVTMKLEGDSNDYIGKGLSGGKIIVVPPTDSIINPSENVIIGNVAFYGAISGEAYIRGIAGERFCVRNSGMSAVVEGVGDHGCEYMTGGCVVVIGETGRNFAAGMSGGIAYVYDKNGDFDSHVNKGLVTVQKPKKADIAKIKEMLEKHLANTNSDVAKAILDSFDEECKKFVKVIPVDYEKVVTIMDEEKAKGTSYEDAMLVAFENVTGKKVS
jgi:glutamate synthase (ferredoxin)